MSVIPFLMYFASVNEITIIRQNYAMFFRIWREDVGLSDVNTMYIPLNDLMPLVARGIFSKGRNWSVII